MTARKRFILLFYMCVHAKRILHDFSLLFPNELYYVALVSRFHTRVFCYGNCELILGPKLVIQSDRLVGDMCCYVLLTGVIVVVARLLTSECSCV